MEDKYKTLESAINKDSTLNNAQKRALHHIRQLCEEKEQAYLSHLQGLLQEEVPAVIKRITS